MTASPATLYKEGALHLLPSFKAWFVAAGGATTDRGWMPIGITVAERVSRALRARDRMQAALQNDQTQENAENALFYLDTFILQLDAALDALARATSTLRDWGLSGSESSWGSRQWCRQVRASGNDAMSKVIAQGPGDDLPRLLSMLRNTIHSSLLPAVTVLEPGQHHRRTHVRLPSEPQRRQLLTYARSCGGYEHWGLNAQRDWLDPSTFVESAIVAVPDLLHRFMVAQYPESPDPTTDGGPNSLARLIRARTLLLLGLPS